MHLFVYNKQLSIIHGMNIKITIVNFQIRRTSQQKVGKSLYWCLVHLPVLSVHFVQFVSVSSCLSLPLSAEISLYCDECGSETDCNISSVTSYYLARPDSTVSHLAGHKRLWFGSWQRHVFYCAINCAHWLWYLPAVIGGYFSHK